PLELLTGHDHLRADQAARALPHGGERLGQDLVQHLGDRLAQLRFYTTAAIGATQLVVDALALRGIARRALGLLETRDVRLELVGALVNDCAELRGLRTKLLLRHALQACVMLVYLVDDRLDTSSFALVAGPKDL